VQKVLTFSAELLLVEPLSDLTVCQKNLLMTQCFFRVLGV